MKTQTLTLGLLMATLSLPALAAESHEGMHQMPDGSWMKNAEMAAPEKAVNSAVKADKTVVASVNGLVCDFCAQSIKKTLMKEPGVTDVKVDLTAKTVTVGLKADGQLEEARLKGLLKEAGYDMIAYKVN
ncbi:MAG TPA: heavy metal-associated domain-containing protein [Alphaproteobacteria bacterium]|nr:heavy metal-associated domain-containing protein [Alphaproteobacteria bacterium]